MNVGAPPAAAALDEPLADAVLGPAERAVRDRVRAVVEEHVATRAAATDRTSEFPEASYQALARAGLAGLLFPTAYGGSGDSTLSYVVAMEEIAAGCGSTSLVYMTQTHAAYPILVSGTEEQRRRHLPALCRGETYGSLAITEPGAGSDASALRTGARREGDAFVLDGEKTFITTGDRAGVVICFATVDPGAGRGGITGFLVPGDAAGLTRGAPMHKLGMNGSSTAQLFLDGVRVPSDAALGGSGTGWDLLTRTLVTSRISTAAQGLGLARGAYARAVGWAAGIGALRSSAQQDVQFRLADIRSRILSARLLLRRVAQAVDEGSDSHPDSDDDHTAAIAMAKATCTDLATAVADEVTDLLGPCGDLTHVEAERYLRDAKVTQIYDGTNEVQRLLVARDLSRRVEAGSPGGGR